MSVLSGFHEHTQNKINNIIFSEPQHENKHYKGESENYKENIFIHTEKCKNNEILDYGMLPNIGKFKYEKKDNDIPDEWVNELKILKASKIESEEFPFLREYIIKPIYCSIYHISSGIYDFTFKDATGNTSSEYIKSGIWNNIYLDERLKILIYSFYKFSYITQSIFDKKSDNLNPDYNKNNYTNPYKLIVIVFSYICFQSVWFFWVRNSKRIIYQLDELHKRIEATDVLESGISQLPLPFFSRRHRKFEKLDACEAENLLLSILELNAKISLFGNPRIIFVFDELDKIKPPKERLEGTTIDPIELGLSESVRQRKYEIEELLGNLKNLITIAPCHFIFIAGREMMDANLADRGEIRFLHSSLFEHIFYIPSFLTDSSDNRKRDISSMVEQYVCRRLLSEEDAKSAEKDIFSEESYSESNPDYSCYQLETYYQHLTKSNTPSDEKFRKIVFIQDFIYFLTYRSGGNPKKLDLFFEEFIQPDEKNNKLNLSFDEKDQYRVHLISYFFIIFHGSYSKLVREYGDKLSVSVFFILDYVCKFHSTAFSRRDLERMHAALDIHRAPALPQVTDLLIDKIMSPYIQKIDNGVYTYRFSFYIQREILYISQFSEQDMAAFNFSLDESIQVKQHYRQLLKEQLDLIRKGESTNYDISNSISNKRNTYVLSYIHAILGDLYAYDNQSDQTIIEYRHAISYLDVIIDSYFTKDKKNNYTEIGTALVLYVRLMLKLGLVQEKRKTYYEAIAVYDRIIRVIDRILSESEGKNFFVSNIEQLNLLQQPYLSIAFLHAKIDRSPSSALYFMDLGIKTIEEIKTSEQQLFDPIKYYSNFKHGQKYNQHKNNHLNISISYYKYQFHMQYAYLWMIRSEYTESLNEFINASRDLKNYNGEKKYLQRYSDIADIFRGIADSLTAKLLSVFYNQSDINDREITSILTNIDCNNNSYITFSYDKNSNDSVDLLFEYLQKIHIEHSSTSNEEMNKYDVSTLLKYTIIFYINSSKAYFLSGDYLNQSITLFSLSYLLTVGLSYNDIPYDDCFYKKIKKDIFNGYNDNDPKNVVRKVFSQVFDSSYSIHRRRFTNIFSDEEYNDRLLWISPPLCQLFILFGYSHNDMDKLQITHLGPFPMHTRIMALYLKGKDKIRIKMYTDAFVFIVESIEEAQAFEGGLDLLSPPLGILYFHIWELISSNRTDEECLKKEYDFIGDKSRYLNVDYIGNRTKTLLTQVLGRHHSNGVSVEHYENYMSNKYYLYNDFSDSYVQMLWANECGLMPRVVSMLDEIDAYEKKV